MAKSFLYREVYQKLKRSIVEGEWLAGDKLPTEEELSEKYSVSAITVKKALSLLKEDHLIRRVQGRGSFVCPLDDSASVYSSDGRKLRLIGVVLEHVSSSFGLTMMYYMDRLLNDAGYKAIIRFSYGSLERESEEIEFLLKNKIAGLIIMPCHDSHYNMTILKLMVENFPVVLVDKRMYGLPVGSVSTDGSGAVSALISHLQERGCKSAALLTIDPATTSSLGDRTEGFYTALEKNGMRNAGVCILPRRTSDMISSEPEMQYVERIEAFLSGLLALPDGIVATEYAIARALYVAAMRMSLTPGRDFKACCIDETELATQGIYFTCMMQDELSLAEQTVQMLIALLKGKTHISREVRVPAIFRQGVTT